MLFASRVGWCTYVRPQQILHVAYPVQFTVHVDTNDRSVDALFWLSSARVEGDNDNRSYACRARLASMTKYLDVAATTDTILGAYSSLTFDVCGLLCAGQSVVSSIAVVVV